MNLILVEDWVSNFFLKDSASLHFWRNTERDLLGFGQLHFRFFKDFLFRAISTSIALFSENIYQETRA